MNYPAIRIEGALLSPDIIDALDDRADQKPAEFGLDSGTRVKDEIARAWADAQDYWRIFQRKLDSLRPESPATTETRNNWVVPLLGLLRYDLEFQKSGVELNGKNYSISHRAVNRAQTPVHIVGYREPAGLDRRPDVSNVRMSAHALVQEYLNLTEQLYGLVTNGRVIRLLRDSSRLVKLSYVEFDLDRIFTDGLFADFAVMYRIIHATRLPVTIDASAECILEKYHQESLDSGARIRDGLSKAVEQAIRTFANGFLAHPANEELREALRDGRVSAGTYYKWLLRLIYRLLFLMVTEERGLVFPSGALPGQRQVYDNYYSVHRLRMLSGKLYLADRRKFDLWQALLSTFRLFEADGPGIKLGLKPLGGVLFRQDSIGLLGTAHLSNSDLLSCIRSLSVYQHPEKRQLIRVNYAALNVEEFGSVYEGLLEYEPYIDTSHDVPAFDFRHGNERAATGSHYTPDELVQPLIKHSLDYLIADRLKTPDPEHALLDLRVADIACGSGHILLAAARRIAAELAVVRTGDEQPTPTAFRAALRDVIRNCIYGVDLNPLAVELCKVALWLEAHNPGEPLNFLDHHIKCGNSIVGFVRREEVDVGVPDEAFARLPGDDANVSKDIRARNKTERLDRGKGTLNFTQNRQNQITAVLETWQRISAMPESTPAEVDAKKVAFEAFSTSGGVLVLNQIASIPIAQFYIPRTEENFGKFITDREFRLYWSGQATPQGQPIGKAIALAEHKRFFNWFLEFPDIIQRGGFDCILGNPPYLGGQDLSGTYGHDFCGYVQYSYSPTGLSDLVAFFLRRMYSLLAKGGFTAFITTNSIKDGTVRRDGLDQVVAQEGCLNFAVRGMKWPGRAKLVISIIAIHKGPWHGARVLDGRSVSVISSYLEDTMDVYEPGKLAENRQRIFQGTILRGDGFIIDENEAQSLLRLSSENDKVIRTIINGSELNSEPDQASGRKVIDFSEMDEAQAASYSGPYSIVLSRVKPIRMQLDASTSVNRDNRERWWQFAAIRDGLYSRARRLPGCFAVARTTKYLNFSRVAVDPVFSDGLCVFTSDRWDLFSVLQSTIHEIWARKYSGALKRDLRYSPTDCFDNFVFPSGLWQAASPSLAENGERYHEYRRQLMLSLWFGLTDVYNLFHSRTLEADLKALFESRAKKDPLGLKIPSEHRTRALAFTYDQALADILELRRLHVELDTAVRNAYGWQDLDLGHDFYEVETLPENDRVRYTISPAARKDILSRLLKENLARAAAESAAAKSTAESATRDKRLFKASSDGTMPKKSKPKPDGDLFDELG